jgi:uncharacterized membrane protein YdbT with pleckstrin-like domain
MSYIDRNLLEGEQIVFRTRLHWLLFLGPALLTVGVLLPLAWLAGRSSASALAAVPLGLGALALLAAYVRRQSSDFAVTNKRVMMKVGVLRTRSIELLLGKIEAISVDQGILGRIFGYGDIVLTGSGGTREPFTGIQAPLDFRRAVQTVTDAQRGAR